MGKAIQDNNLLYNILSPLVQFGCKCHYNHFDVHGLDNLPTNGSYIIAPCHQQALMEPLAVLCFAPKPPVFLARADIFRKPTLRTILTFLKIMPVYRIRDGQDQLERNKEIFDRCRDVLLDGYPLCLMAEGRHNNRHHLLNMGKGMFRIAGETQLALGNHPLYIVPTGIDFDEYERPYSNLVVNIGKPIPVQPFMEEYQADEPVALNQMRDALFKQLLPLMHDIRNEEHYEEVLTLCNILNKEMRQREGLKNNAWNRFRIRQQISTKFGAQSLIDPSILSTLQALKSTLAELKLNDNQISEHWTLLGTLLSLLTILAVVVAIVVIAPVRWVILFCLLCYPMAVLPTHRIVRKKIADPQFRSSFNFGVRFFPSVLYTIVIAIVVAANGGMWMSHIAGLGAWWGLVAVAIVPLCARITGPITVFLRNIVNNNHYWLLRVFQRNAMHEIDKNFKRLADLI